MNRTLNVRQKTDPPTIPSTWPTYRGTIPLDGMLSQLVASRTILLGKHCNAIRKQIAARQSLAGAHKRTIDDELCDAASALLELDERAPVGQPRRDRRIALEQRIAGLNEEQRRTAVGSWQDTVALSRELRTMERDLRNALLDLWTANYVSGIRRNN